MTITLALTLVVVVGIVAFYFHSREDEWIPRGGVGSIDGLPVKRNKVVSLLQRKTMDPRD